MTSSQKTDNRSPLTGRDVVILAGGLGTRIRPVLGDTPKALAAMTVAADGGDGETVLGLLLRRLEAQGADRILLALGHRAEAVVDWLAVRPPGGPVIVPVVEPAPLGTAGALRHIRPQLRPGPVVVMNGDTLVDTDFAALLARHGEAAAPITVLCVRTPDCSRYGRVELTDDHRFIVRFLEKSPNAGPGPINAGVYVFSDAALDVVAAGTAGSLEREVFQTAAPGFLAVLATAGRFVDVGTPEGLAAARAMIAESGD